MPKDKVKIVKSYEEKGKKRKNEILKLAGSIDKFGISPLKYQKKIKRRVGLDKSII